jgi:hypothetical protein
MVAKIASPGLDKNGELRNGPMAHFLFLRDLSQRPVDSRSDYCDYGWAIFEKCGQGARFVIFAITDECKNYVE